MTARDYEVRAALSADVPALVRFNRDIARETEAIELDPEIVTAGVRALFAHPERGFYVVAEAGGRIAGSLMVTTEWSDWRNGLFWWLQSVYVHPDHRRRGVYRLLYGHVRERARAHPEVCGFRLYVERDNHAAQRTYTALGMTPTPYLMYEALTRASREADT